MCKGISTINNDTAQFGRIISEIPMCTESPSYLKKDKEKSEQKYNTTLKQLKRKKTKTSSKTKMFPLITRKMLIYNTIQNCQKIFIVFIL